MNSNTSLYPEPPLALRQPNLKYLARYVGPGVIIASVTIGSGELVYAARSGAIFGYGLLWCFLYAGVFKAIQVYTAARHITLTGEHPLVAWAKLPGPPMWFPLLIALPAVVLMPVAFSAIPEMLAGFVHRVLGMAMQGSAVGPYAHMEFWVNVWAAAVLVMCLTMALGSSYVVLERVSIVVLGAIVLGVGISVIVIGPQLAELLSGLFLPRRPVYPDWLLQNPRYAAEFQSRSPWLEVSIYLGAVGGGAYDYIGYVGMLREKKWGLAGRQTASRQELDDATSGDSDAARQTVARGRIWTRAALIDICTSFFFVIVVTLLFAVLAALVLHSEQVVPANNDLLNEQERFLSRWHHELRWVYRGGVLLAFIGTLYGAFEVYQHTFAESLLAIAPRFTTPRRIPFIRRGVVAYCFLGGMVMIWLPEAVSGNIIERMTFGSIISGAASCGLWCFAMLWTDRTRLPPPLRMHRLAWGLTFLAGAAMTSLGIVITIEYFR